MTNDLRAWTLGDITVRKLIEVEFPFSSGAAGSIVPEATPGAVARTAWLHPDFVTSDSKLKGSIHAFPVETPTARIVVDPCVGNAKPCAAAAFNMLDASFIQDFVHSGWTRERVTHVICTHPHMEQKVVHVQRTLHWL